MGIKELKKIKITFTNEEQKVLAKAKDVLSDIADILIHNRADRVVYSLSEDGEWLGGVSKDALINVLTMIEGINKSGYIETEEMECEDESNNKE